MAVGEMNCWEYQKCGKEPGCPAYPDHGRECYKVQGTHCYGEATKVSLNKVVYYSMHKIENCKHSCEFYRHLQSGQPITSAGKWEERGDAIPRPLAAN